MITEIEKRVIDASREVLKNWLGVSEKPDVSEAFFDLERAFDDYDNNGEHIIEKQVDWNSFRRNAAKDILCAMLSTVHEAYKEDITTAIKITDELIKQLKEK